MDKSGSVILCGAGCAGIDWLTIAAKEALEQADTVLYDALVDPDILNLASKAEKIYVGKRSANHALPQRGIEDLMISQAQDGKQVVRLKGGDPYVFGRGMEEMERLESAGISVRAIPGISSALGLLMKAHIPATHRAISESFTVITAHQKDGPTDFSRWHDYKDTLIILMGISRMESIFRELNKPEAMGAVIWTCKDGSCRWVTGKLKDLPALAKENGAAAPGILVIGDVCSLSRPWQKPITIVSASTEEFARRLNSFLGDRFQVFPAFQTAIRPLHPALKSAFEASPGWLVFTSANGVHAFFKALDDQNLDHRSLGSWKLACIGPATADALKQHGFIADLVPDVYTSKALADKLLSEAGPSKRMVTIRSEDGSKLLEAHLARSGSDVSRLDLYKVDYQPSALPDEIDGVVFGSALALKAFRDLYSDIPETECYCISQAVADLLPEDAAATVARACTADSIAKDIRSAFQ